MVSLARTLRCAASFFTEPKRRHIDLGGPEAVVLAEPAVLEALWLSESIFLPEQRQGYAGTAQLGVYPRQSGIGRWSVGTGTAGGNSRRFNSASEISRGH